MSLAHPKVILHLLPQIRQWRVAGSCQLSFPNEQSCPLAPDPVQIYLEKPKEPKPKSTVTLV